MSFRQLSWQQRLRPQQLKLQWKRLQRHLQRPQPRQRRPHDKRKK
jgi:hypothetical protein